MRLEPIRSPVSSRQLICHLSWQSPGLCVQQQMENPRTSLPHRHPTGMAPSAPVVHAWVFFCTRGLNLQTPTILQSQTILKPLIPEVIKLQPPKSPSGWGISHVGRDSWHFSNYTVWMSVSDDKSPGTFSASQVAPSCPPSLFNQVSVALMGKGRR